MNNGQRQEQRQKQKLSPQQMLLMRILPLSTTDLEQMIKEEMERNPMLEVSSVGSDNVESLPEPVSQDAVTAESEDTQDDDYGFLERKERDANQSPNYPSLVSHQNFGDQLLDQLSFRNLTPRQMLIAQDVIGSITPSGYVERSVELIANDMAITSGLEVDPDEVREVLSQVQQLDPPGIGARNLQECLLIQLRRIESPSDADKLALKIIEQGFDYFAHHNHNRLLEQFQVSTEQLQSAYDSIQRLNPKPGIGDGPDSQSAYIVPDFIVGNVDGHLSLHLNNRQLPRIKFSSDYQQMLSDLMTRSALSPADKSTFDFLRTNNENANQLVQALDQRHSTMMAVMKDILRVQHQYFLSGDVADKVPLLQKDVAERTGFDLSTISRVVNDKYVQTEFGTFALKEFFSLSVKNGLDEDVATDAVRLVLQEIIDAEDKAQPYSDDALSELMKKKGFPIARRTVAKYRDILHIPSARQRRLLKMSLLILMLALPMFAFSQQPQHESYFDSLLNARIREGQAQARKGKEPRADAKSKSHTKVHSERPDVPNGSLEIHEPEPQPNAIDTALAIGDDLIDVMYDKSLPAPSALWYGSNISGAHVRMGTLSMDSLPDELSIQLIKGNEKFAFPVKNIITSPYGWRWNRPHRGVDIRLKMGEPVHAAFNGVVRISRPMGAYGNLVVIRHYNGLETVYGHLSKINVKPLQIVKAGQTIGLGGSTGRSTGPHLHFEVRFQYEAFDPEWILDFSNYSLRTRRLYLDKTYFGIRQPRAGEGVNYKADKSIVPEEPVRSKTPSNPVYATLKKGETLDQFAKRNYTTVDKLLAINPDLDKTPKSGSRIRVR